MASRALFLCGGSAEPWGALCRASGAVEDAALFHPVESFEFGEEAFVVAGGDAAGGQDEAPGEVQEAVLHVGVEAVGEAAEAQVVGGRGADDFAGGAGVDGEVDEVDEAAEATLEAGEVEGQGALGFGAQGAHEVPGAEGEFGRGEAAADGDETGDFALEAQLEWGVWVFESQGLPGIDLDALHELGDAAIGPAFLHLCRSATEEVFGLVAGRRRGRECAGDFGRVVCDDADLEVEDALCGLGFFDSWKEDDLTGTLRGEEDLTTFQDLRERAERHAEPPRT